MSEANEAERALGTGISVIICTWNRADLLRITLDSLSAQRYEARGPIEVLVVDNNSTDHTMAVVKEAQSKWKLGSLRYEFEPTQGKQFALNHGIKAASHELLAFTDDDIIFPGDWLVQAYRVLSDPGVDLAGGKTLIDWTGVTRPCWYSDDMLAVLAGVDDGDARLDPAPSQFAPGGSNLVTRQSTFKRFGLYSEAHFRHMDHEFGLRCQAAGARVVYEPALVVSAPVDQRYLTKRYFKRWSFKSGIARTGGIHAAGRRPNIPRWMFARVTQDVLALLLTVGARNRPDHFSRQLRVWRDLGAIANALSGWLRPARHAEWVTSRSQKKGGVY